MCVWGMRVVWVVPVEEHGPFAMLVLRAVLVLLTVVGPFAMLVLRAVLVLLTVVLMRCQGVGVRQRSAGGDFVPPAMRRPTCMRTCLRTIHLELPEACPHW